MFHQVLYRNFVQFQFVLCLSVGTRLWCKTFHWDSWQLTPSCVQMKWKSAQRDANTARCLCRWGPSSISVPIMKRIAQLVQKLLRGFPNYEIMSRYPGHAHLGPVCGPCAGRLRPQCLYQIEADCSFRSKVIRGSQISPQADPLSGGGGAGRPKFNQRWSLPYLQIQFGEDRRTQFRLIVATDPHRLPATNTQTGPITIHCVAS